MKKIKLFLSLLVMMISLVTSYSGYAQTPVQQNPGGWEAVGAITDEFNGGNLNLNKWKFGHPFWVGRSPMLFGQGANAYLENGKLMMQVTVFNNNGNGNYLRGGAIYSTNRSMKEGMYIESRYRASGLRIGSGFWLVNNDLDADRRADEIDIQEAFGGINARTQHNTNVHNPQPNFTNDQPQPQSFTIPNGGTVSGEAHTYGLWWVNSRTIRFYLDGVLKRELRTNSTLQPMHALLNTETYNFMTPPTIAEVNGPIDPRYIKRAAFEYIRTWKPKEGGGPSGTENVTLGNISNQTPNNSYTFQVNYTANQQRDVQVEVRAPDNTWLGLGKVTVNSGSGNVNVTVNLSTTASVGNGYKATTLLVPVGSDWTQLIKSDSKFFNVVTSGGGTPPAGDSFYILNRQTQKRIRPQSDVDASKIIQVASNSTGNYVKWEQVNTSGGYFYLKNVQTGKYFRPAGDNDGLDLEQRPTTYSGNYTQWRKVNTSNGYFYLQNRQTGMYFRPTGNNNNDKLIQRPTSYSGNYTQWTFQNASARATSRSIEKTNFEVNTMNNLGTIDLNIISTEIGKVSVEVFNLSGESVYTDTFKSLSKNVTMRLEKGTIATGIYIAKVSINGEIKTIKFSL